VGISAGGSKNGPKSDINVTPLVDIVLVLLIIFLLAMPIQIRKIAIEVPRELKADEISVTTATTIEILGKADGSVVLNDGSGETSFARVQLAKNLRDLFQKSPDTEKVVFVDFEDPVKYRDVVSIMDTVRGVAPKRKVETPDGKTKMEPDVKIALKIRDGDKGRP
jgi:biopolymer transport protein ExbD